MNYLKSLRIRRLIDTLLEKQSLVAKEIKFLIDDVNKLREKKEISQAVIDKAEISIKNLRKSLVEAIGETVFLTLRQKKYMQNKFGCEYCAYYHKVQLPAKKIKKKIETDFLNMSKRKQSEEQNDEVKDSGILFLMKELTNYALEHEKYIPSLCIYKNQIRSSPCRHFSLKIMGLDVKERLNFQNSLLSRKFTTLGVAISTILSVCAIIISLISFIGKYA